MTYWVDDINILSHLNERWPYSVNLVYEKNGYNLQRTLIDNGDNNKFVIATRSQNDKNKFLVNRLFFV